ncbi:DNA recombination protein RmuC [Gilvimarinus agarilyticus]|nr:DNA recombination protein RmuC [Gilvimarinus agarilyticus]
MSMLEESVSRHQLSLQSARSELEAYKQRHETLREFNTTAKTKLAQFEQLQNDYKNLQRQFVSLTASNAKLEAELDSERSQSIEKLAILDDAKQALTKEFENTANKLFDRKAHQFDATSQNLLTGTLQPFKNQIESFRKKVEDVYEKENSDRSKLAGQIIELQKQAQRIGQDAIQLADALKGNNKSQGNWGEVILERLLEQSGLQKGREYETQQSMKDAQGQKKIPDVVIHLPEGKHIVIDAKVSLTHYEKYCSADNEDSRQTHLQAHINSFKSHIKNLSAKDYEQLPEVRGLDFVFIFVPIEAAFMLALQNDMSLYSDAYNKNIILTSPTTLLAMLRTIENLWRNDKQNRNAERIANEAGALHDQFILLLESLEAVGDGLDRTQKAFDLTQRRLQLGRGNLLRKVDNMKKLGAKTKKIMPEHYHSAINQSPNQDENNE